MFVSDSDGEPIATSVNLVSMDPSALETVSILTYMYFLQSKKIYCTSKILEYFKKFQ